MAVVFYAGHSIEVGQANYLIPVDARLITDYDVEDETVPLDRVQAMEPAKRLRVVILDACRNNPLGESMSLSAGVTRTVTRGLARIEPRGDVLVAYSARAGTLAQDGKGRHSPYAEALLKHMMTPALDVRLMFGKVRDQVLLATGREQEPFIYGSLSGDVIPLVPEPPTAQAPLPVPPPAPMPLSAADRMWATVKNSTSIPALEAFRQQYGKDNLVYDRLAEARIEELKRQQTAMLNAAQDRKRAEDERKRAEGDLLRPGRVSRDCPDVCPEMVVLPAGEFMMGSNEYDSEKPPRKVTISRPFAVGKFEVTFSEWEACVADGGCTHRPADQHGWGRGRRPVINVSWHDAKEYVGWLSRKTGKSYRLLSEAEWEFAARAGTTTRYAFGDRITKSQAQFSEGSWSSTGKTVEVGSFPANRFGLHDLHGNVWEWVEDAWHPNYHGAPVDGSAWQGGDAQRVLRGGSWMSINPDDLRSGLPHQGPTGPPRQHHRLPSCQNALTPCALTSLPREHPAHPYV